MTMSDSVNATDWLRQIRTENDIRIALRDSEGLIAPAELEASLGESDEKHTFELATPSEGVDTRHRVRFSEDENQLQHEEWYRYIFKLDSNPDTEFLLEIRAESHSGSIPIEALTISESEIAEFFDHPSVKSASENRVAGLTQQKQQLRRFLEAENSDWGLSNQAGVLLEGPPGTGKTELVIETCEELFGGLPVTISGPEILNKWVGESERLLREKFREARESSSQVLYIDEIDAIARSRSEATQDHSAQLVAQLLVLLDGIDAKTENAPKVVASTNLADVLDPALLRPGRLGNQPITFPRPGRLERKAIFHHYFEQIRTSERGRIGTDLRGIVGNPQESDQLEDLVSATESYTGADIEDVIIAAVSELKANAEQNTPELEISDIYHQIDEREIQTETPSMSEEAIDDTRDRIVQLNGEGQVAQLQEPITSDIAKSVANAWQQHINDTSEEFILRTVEANQLLGSSTTETHDRVITVFQHDSDTRLCLCILDFPSIARAANHTPSADVVLEAIHEQLIRWEEENLLMYRQVDDDQSYLAAEHLEVSY